MMPIDTNHKTQQIYDKKLIFEIYEAFNELKYALKPLYYIYTNCFYS